MKIKYPNNLKPKEYKLAFEKAYQNAIDHKKASELLAQNNLNAFAFSHLVFAGEELSKAIILFFASHGLKPQKFDKYFSSHSDKHELLLKIHELQLDSHKVDADENTSDKYVFWLIIGIILISTWANSEHTENIDEAFEQDSKYFIESLRQNSLYVDFDVKEKVFKHPSEIISIDYFETGLQVLESTFMKAKVLFTKDKPSLDVFFDDLMSLEER